MVEPWLTFVGINEDGLAGLSEAARAALDAAEVVFGGPRHLALAGVAGRAWPVPFDPLPVMDWRGRRVVVLASGDPFWHGAGGSLLPHLAPDEWVSLPAPSTFQLVANRLGWRMEEVLCLGLHAAPFERLVPHLYRGARIIALLRDGQAPAALAEWLVARGHGDSVMHVLEAVGGPGARLRSAVAGAFDLRGTEAPVAVAFVASGAGIPRSSGLPDDSFAHDGQITKAPIRAMTLAALAPSPGLHLWDVGAGSGSISMEFCLAGGRATAVEAKAPRVANIRANAESFGIAHRMAVVEGEAPAALAGLPLPDVVFIGGGCNAGLLDHLWEVLPPGTRVVANAVTLETEALLIARHADAGGTLMRVEVSVAGPLGPGRGWSPARPVVQWSVLR